MDEQALIAVDGSLVIHDPAGLLSAAAGLAPTTDFGLSEMVRRHERSKRVSPRREPGPAAGARPRAPSHRRQDDLDQRSRVIRP